MGDPTKKLIDKHLVEAVAHLQAARALIYGNRGDPDLVEELDSMVNSVIGMREDHYSAD